MLFFTVFLFSEINHFTSFQGFGDLDVFEGVIIMSLAVPVKRLVGFMLAGFSGTFLPTSFARAVVVV